MTGKDFRMIREFNLVSKEDFFKEFGETSTELLDEIENDSIIPSRAITILGDLIGVNLLDYNICYGEIKKVRRYIRKRDKLYAKNQLQQGNHGCIIR
jgi:hypothetical protein